MTADTSPAPTAALLAPRRTPAFGRRLAVATDHPLTSMTAFDVLRGGGNAVDATIAAAAVNCVAKPERTHIGGDAFALIWHRRTGEVECLNSGGRAPLAATREQFPDGIPARGPRASTVPGIVDSWVALHARHGTRPLSELLAPAVKLAAEGFPATLHLSTNSEMLADAEPEIRRLMWNGERPHRPGELIRQPELAQTLARIAADGRDGFYGGKTAELIVRRMRDAGGLIAVGDFEEPTAKWDRPVSTTYRGCTVYEQALPSQGIILLEALSIADRFPIAEWGFLHPNSVHVMAEATRHAFADIRAHAGDPDFGVESAEWLISPAHIDAVVANIDLDHITAPNVSIRRDTTSFVVADEDTVVAYIQSVFALWGARFAIPGTGILMNNRLTGFNLDPSHPNTLEPGKRTVHTLNNFLVVRDGALVVGGGTPGADFQVQTNLQVVSAVVDHGFDLTTAVDSPRWATQSDYLLNLENRIDEATATDLERRGHVIRRPGPWHVRACSQVVASLPGGGWSAASDLRGEGLALGL